MLYIGVVVWFCSHFRVLIEVNVTIYLLWRLLFSSVSWTLHINIIIIIIVIIIITAILFVRCNGLLFIGG